MIDRLRQRVELKEGATVVVDRGMAFDDNLAEIKGSPDDLFKTAR
jgi:hypothetical protein